MSNVRKQSSYALHFLEKSYSEGKLVHAYLFFGGCKEEKLNVAKKFAKLVLGADEMRSRLIDKDEHANVIIIRPDGKNIKKEQIIFLKTEIAKKSVEDRAKVYIIEDADKMSLPATNSLLKFLEEPAADVYIILISPSKEVLLPTIVSRTVNLGFKVVHQENHPIIKEELLAVIKQLEEGAPPPIVVAKNPDIFKDQTVEFLDAYQVYDRAMLEQSLSGKVSEIKRITKRLRAVEVAKRSLKHNMNVQLCLDKLWIDFG